MDIAYKKSARAKKLSIKVRSDGSVLATVPRWTSIRQAQSFVESHKEWIQRSLEKITPWLRKLTTNEIQELKRAAKNHLPNRTHALAKQHGIQVKWVTVRHQKTRWGSCSGRNSISLNCELMRVSEDLRDYVILHELAHVLHKDHSHRFWDFLESICPWSKKLDKQLKKYPLWLAKEQKTL